MKIKKSNQDIYTACIGLNNLIQQNLTLPIKVNFFLDKNYKILSNLAEEIESTRRAICEKYGKLNENKNVYECENKEDQEKANEELQELANIEQEFEIHMIPLKDFGNIDISIQQMQAISFMIAEDD